jgi:hypothetical protein
MIKPYIKNETAVDIICSICDRVYPGMGCEPADCEWMKMLAEEAVDAVPVVRCKDCKYFDSDDNWLDRWEYCKKNCIDVSEDWFCKSGMREDKENEK